MSQLTLFQNGKKDDTKPLVGKNNAQEGDIKDDLMDNNFLMTLYDNQEFDDCFFKCNQLQK